MSSVSANDMREGDLLEYENGLWRVTQRCDCAGCIYILARTNTDLLERSERLLIVSGETLAVTCC